MVSRFDLYFSILYHDSRRLGITPPFTFRASLSSHLIDSNILRPISTHFLHFFTSLSHLWAWPQKHCRCSVEAGSRSNWYLHFPLEPADFVDP